MKIKERYKKILEVRGERWTTKHEKDYLEMAMDEVVYNIGNRGGESWARALLRAKELGGEGKV